MLAIVKTCEVCVGSTRLEMSERPKGPRPVLKLKIIRPEIVVSSGPPSRKYPIPAKAAEACARTRSLWKFGILLPIYLDRAGRRTPTTIMVSPPLIASI